MDDGDKQKAKDKCVATSLKPVFALSKLQLGSSVFSYGNTNVGDTDYGLSTAMLLELLTMVFNW